MLTSTAVRLASRRIVSTSTERAFASAARVAKDESNFRHLAPLFAAAGLAAAGSTLYRAEVGHEVTLGRFGRFCCSRCLFPSQRTNQYCN